MPPLPPCPAIKVEAIYNISGLARAFVNIYHVGYTGGPPTGGTLAAFAALMDPAIDTEITTSMHTSSVHSESIYTDLSSATGAVVVTTPGVAGGNSGTIAPLSVAAVISWAIARRYRGGHPRTYVGGLSDAQLSDPISLNPTFAGNLQVQAGGLISDVLSFSSTLPGSALVTVSYRTGNAQRVTPVIEQILGAAVHPLIRSQRRRLAAA
jgi:hypothetical protein